jgi:hypothetical protein
MTARSRAPLRPRSNRDSTIAMRSHPFVLKFKLISAVYGGNTGSNPVGDAKFFERHSATSPDFLGTIKTRTKNTLPVFDDEFPTEI